MSVPRRARFERRAILLLALVWPGLASADRLSSLTLEKHLLEQQMVGLVNDVIERIAGPGRAHVSISLVITPRVLSEKKTERGQAMSFTMGKVSNEKMVKLPGLPSISPGKISQPVKIRLDPRGRSSVSSALLGEIARIRARLYLDPALPAQRSAAIKTVVTEMVGIDRERGDTLEVIGLPPLSTPKPSSARWIRLARLALIVAPLALVLGMGLLALGLSRRGGRAQAAAAGTPEGAGGTRAPRADGAEGEQPVGEAEIIEVQSAASGRFAELGEASADELHGVASRLDDTDLCRLLALAPLQPAALRATMDRLPPARRRAVIAGLGQQQQVPVEELDTLQQRLDEVLDAVRHPTEMPVGGAERLAQLLTWSSRATAREVLEALEADDPELAKQTRARLVQFEDLPQVDTPTLRRLVTALDPEVLAHALHGADDKVVKAVRQALSRRLLRILDEERKLIKNLSDEAVEQAREKVQQTLAAQRVS